ncbi:MAG: hypothetical protein QOG71_3883 [Pyrinomonadaceae bacterium]|nr:hypothetical protein [Pyrinomonadaceae bacterium]
MESMPEHNQPSKEELLTLKDFIDDHQKVLAVIGVLIALSVFWGNQPLKHISSFISFLCLAATIPLFLEIYLKFNHKTSSWLLIVFLNIFTPLMGYTAWYLLIGFRSQWKTQMWNVIFWVFAIPAWLIYRRINLSERIFSWLASHHLKTMLRNNEKLLAASTLPDEENQKFREKWTEEAKAKIQPPPPLERKALHIYLNVLAGALMLLIFGYVADYASKRINNRLDKVYESYNAAEATPSPTTTPTPSVTPTPTATPTPHASVDLTPTPAPSPTAQASPSPIQTKRRRSSSR